MGSAFSPRNKCPERNLILPEESHVINTQVAFLEVHDIERVSEWGTCMGKLPMQILLLDHSVFGPHAV